MRHGAYLGAAGRRDAFFKCSSARGPTVGMTDVCGDCGGIRCAGGYGNIAHQPGCPSGKISRLRAVLVALLDSLPRCDLRRRGVCENRATVRCLDAAGDPVWTCHEHAFTGGMVGEDEPIRLVWTEAADAAQEALK